MQNITISSTKPKIYKSFQDYLNENNFIGQNENKFQKIAEDNLPVPNKYVLCKRKTGKICIAERVNMPFSKSSDPSRNCHWFGYYLDENSKSPIENTINFSDVTVEGWYEFNIQDFYNKSILMKKVLLWIAGSEILISEKNEHNDDFNDESEKYMTDVGYSSQTMAFTACGITEWKHHPHDISDLSRCLTLVSEIPEISLSFDAISKISIKWKRIIENWESLNKKYKEYKENKISYKEISEYFEKVKNG